MCLSVRVRRVLPWGKTRVSVLAAVTNRVNPLFLTQSRAFVMVLLMVVILATLGLRSGPVLRSAVVVT